MVILKVIGRIILFLVVVSFIMGVLGSACYGITYFFEASDYYSEATDVDRVFMMESTHFVCHILQDNGSVKVMEFYGHKPEIIVNKESKPRIEYVRRVYRFSGDGETRTLNKLYLPDLKAVEGGGWNHGKFGHGSTVPLN